MNQRMKRRRNLRLDVFFTPSSIVVDESSANDIYIVVDVIRATTSMAVMFDQGASRVFVAGSVEQARQAASISPGRLLCGAPTVQRIPGLDYFALDDAVCAGHLALELQRQYADIYLWESARAAIALYEAYKPPKVLDYSRSAWAVVEGGLPDDPPFCMRTSVSTSVPMVVGREKETGLLMLEKS